MVAHVYTRIRVLKETLLVVIQIKVHLEEHTLIHFFETIKIRMHPCLGLIVDVPCERPCQRNDPTKRIRDQIKPNVGVIRVLINKGRKLITCGQHRAQAKAYLSLRFMLLRFRQNLRHLETIRLAELTWVPASRVECEAHG